MFALAGAHFVADLIGGILPGILPVALRHFGISLGVGVVILTCISIGSNILQIPAAQFEKKTRRPRLLYVGLALSALIVLLAALPAGTPVPVLCLLMLIVGIGIAIIHPTGLRGAQNIRGLAQTVTTPAFMIGGFLGYAMGPWVGANLIERFGLAGLYFLLLPAAAVALALHGSRVRLAVDSGTAGLPKKPQEHSPWSFRQLMLIAFFLNTGSLIIQALLPTFLNTKGFSLSFSGFCAMLFGIGSALGSIGIGLLARRFRPERFILGGLLLGVPVTLAYLLLAARPEACILSFAAGLLVSSGFPLIVALARHAANGPSLGTRMALIVGGTWGAAGAVFLAVGQAASYFGLETVMHTVWIFYLLALLTAYGTLPRRRPEMARQ